MIKGKGSLKQKDWQHEPYYINEYKDVALKIDIFFYMWSQEMDTDKIQSMFMLCDFLKNRTETWFDFDYK